MHDPTEALLPYLLAVVVQLSNLAEEVQIALRQRAQKKSGHFSDEAHGMTESTIQVSTAIGTTCSCIIDVKGRVYWCNFGVNLSLL